MTKVLVTESYLSDTAQAIRDKNGLELYYRPSQFAEAINNLSIGAPVIEPLSVYSNGVYNVPSGINGYSPVTVNIPNRYESSDEGKVLYNGELINQNSSVISANGMYDTTILSQISVNVPTTS